MWIILGVSAIIMTILNIVLTLSHRDTKWLGYISLSLTALTLCALNSQTAQWVLKEDWSALMDVIPAMTRILWFLTIASIAINGISLIKKNSQAR